MKYVYPVILYPDDDKVGVTVPDLPGCHTYGDDKADAPFSQILQQGLKEYLRISD